MRLSRTIIAFVVLQLGLSGCTNYHNKQKLMDVAGISDIADYLAYEGTVSTTVLLDNGGLIWMHNIRPESFVDTDQIYVVQIGNVFIDCEYPGQLGDTSSGHNIVAISSHLAQDAVSAPVIRNIAQLVENYDDVVSLIDTLPERGDRGEEIVFPHRQPPEWTCFKIVQE